MKLFRQKPTRFAVGLLLVLLGCQTQQDTFKEFAERGETIYIGKPKVKTVPSGLNKVRFFVTVNFDPKIDSGKVLDVVNEVIHKFAVDRKALEDNTLDFEVTFDKKDEGSQTLRVKLQDKDKNESMVEEVQVDVLGARYEANLLTRRVTVATGREGVILDWGDTLARSFESTVAYTTTSDQAMTQAVPHKTTVDGQERETEQTVLSDVKPGSMLKVHTSYRPSKGSGVFNSKKQIYRVEWPEITSISPLKGGEGTEVTITGENFHPTAAENTVLFGTVEVPVSTASATSLIVTVPEGITLGDHAITMKVGAATIPGQTFKVTAKE